MTSKSRVVMLTLEQQCRPYKILIKKVACQENVGDNQMLNQVGYM